MIAFTAAAEQQFDELLEHYARLGRFEASRALVAAIDHAMLQIERDPAAGLPAPRPYPHVKRPGRAWIKAGRYWVGYQHTAYGGGGVLRYGEHSPALSRIVINANRCPIYQMPRGQSQGL